MIGKLEWWLIEIKVITIFALHFRVLVAIWEELTADFYRSDNAQSEGRAQKCREEVLCMQKQTFTWTLIARNRADSRPGQRALWRSTRAHFPKGAVTAYHEGMPFDGTTVA